MLVSTIIPTYNRARQARVAIDSALAQTHADQEIIVVDDGSKDDTQQQLATYGDRIRYFRKANGGVSSARNFGVEQARGDVIAFLDSDDEWEPGKLAAQVALLEARPEIDLVLTDMTVIDHERRPQHVHSRRTTIPEDGWVLRYILRNPALTPSTAMMRTEVFRALGGFDRELPTAEDLDFHLRLALRHQIAVIPEPLTRYMRSEEGLSAALRTYDDYIFVIERFVRLHGADIPPGEQREALFVAYTRNAFGLLHRGQLRHALKLGWKSLPHAHNLHDARVLGGLSLKFGRTLAGHVARRVGVRGGAWVV